MQQLDLHYGPLKRPSVIIDERAFNDDYTPKIFFVSADPNDGDWFIGSTQPSCGKWMYNAHLFMEKVRHHQLSPEYERLYRDI